jgi:chromosome partitioning protein
VALRDALDELRSEFDLVLIDCPPNLALCSWSALVASDVVVVPLQPEDFGCQGIAAVRRMIDEVLAEANDGLRLAGYLLTMVHSRLTLHRAYEKLLRQAHGDQVFGARLPLAALFKEAAATRTPIPQWKPKAPAAQAIRDLADELLRRIRALAREPGATATQPGEVA